MFGNPGTTELPFMDALLRKPSIHYVLARRKRVQSPWRTVMRRQQNQAF
ncbi:hypothetical protein LNP17_14940 [Klebsiella variicola subsp. variicola]|nr:hypothetical protein [Klebsiella variicola subsp. variicola]